MMTRIQTLMVLLLMVIACSGPDNTRITDSWVRLPPPNMQMTAAYLLIENPSSEGITLISATSPSIKLIEMHKTESNNGVATMVQQEQVTIPAKGMVSFEPGGLHFMLIGFNDDLTEQNSVSLTLNWSDGTSSVVSAKVLRGKP